ncbi:MAG: hypothetical protein KGI82_00935 [Betaproteobacteria bacterium]|nr:hypothetical protein [Betaproteobacteria bacterium]
MTSAPPAFDPLRYSPSARRERLNLIAVEFKLTNGQIGRIVNRTRQQIGSWRRGSTQIPEPSLRLLELELGTRGPRGIAAAEP